MKALVPKAAPVERRATRRGNDRRLAIEHPRHRILSLAAGAAALPAVSRMAWAQAYPSRPVRIIVGFAAGGGADFLARLVGQWLAESLRRPFLIENRTGAGGNIGAEAVVNARPDGYTLLMTGQVNVINTTLYDKLNFVFHRDIAPVASVMSAPQSVDIPPSVPVNTLGEFIASAKARPGKLNMGSGGVGTPQHIAGELFRVLTGVDLVHVPYRGGAPAIVDLMGGQLQVMFDVIPEAIEYIRTRRLRSLAVTTAVRHPAMPDVPTVGEFVPGYEASTWWGLGAPRNAPVEVINKLNREINEALADPKIKARLADLGGTVLPGSLAEFGKLIADETEKWGKVIRAANIKVQ
jgi:tripartite-type tricarboxylate transporter receptor subunit TctC